MKNLFAIGVVLLITMGAKAQTADDIAFFQSIWGMEKRAIVESYMDLSEADAAAFWLEYEAYELARKELGQDRVNILSDYAKNYGSLTGEKATELINRGAKNNIAIQKLLKKTHKKMSKSVDAVTVAKFIQLENYFMVMIQMTIQESIPFVDEFK